MSLDPQRLAALIAAHGRIARVVVASVQGSAPREPGAAVLVWEEDQDGTIGGGALEYRAVTAARAALRSGSLPPSAGARQGEPAHTLSPADHARQPEPANPGLPPGLPAASPAPGLSDACLQADVPDPDAPLSGDTALRIPLGPALGQCCGGAVTLLTEFWDERRLARLTGSFYARPLPPAMRPMGSEPSPGLAATMVCKADAARLPEAPDGLAAETAPGPAPETSGDAATGRAADLSPLPPELPPKLARRLEALRNGSRLPQTEVLAGWLIEPVRPAGRPLWIWGAGHVGRALVSVLAPLPGFYITWCDTATDRFPDSPTPAVRRIASPDLPQTARLAPPDSLHLILTYSHEIDLALCHALLTQGFSWCGLIGSATKWARFRNRLAQLGHPPAVIDRITCPIGQKSYGKHPQAIAIGVAADLLWAPATPAATKDIAG